jgi:hypothetical protein
MRLEDLEIPENPGPLILGRDPIVGSVRRTLDVPVLRDRMLNGSPLMENIDTDNNETEADQQEKSVEQSSNDSTEKQTTNTGMEVPEIDF